MAPALRLIEEGEIRAEADPMRNVRPPLVPEEPVPMLSDVELGKLIRACEGGDFADRRDLAIVRAFIDCGLRLSELCALTVADVDFDIEVLRVLGKGRRPRAVPFGVRAGRALDRYLRARAAHREAAQPALWLGVRGPLTP